MNRDTLKVHQYEKIDFLLRVRKLLERQSPKGGGSPFWEEDIRTIIGRINDEVCLILLSAIEAQVQKTLPKAEAQNEQASRQRSSAPKV